MQKLPVTWLEFSEILKATDIDISGAFKSMGEILDSMFEDSDSRGSPDIFEDLEEGKDEDEDVFEEPTEDEKDALKGLKDIIDSVKECIAEYDDHDSIDDLLDESEDEYESNLQLVPDKLEDLLPGLPRNLQMFIMFEIAFAVARPEHYGRPGYIAFCYSIAEPGDEEGSESLRVFVERPDNVFRSEVDEDEAITLRFIADDVEIDCSAYRVGDVVDTLVGFFALYRILPIEFIAAVVEEAEDSEEGVATLRKLRGQSRFKTRKIDGNSKKEEMYQRGGTNDSDMESRRAEIADRLKNRNK